jgi:hypothetical protein
MSVKAGQAQKTVPRTGTGPWLPRLAGGNFSAKQATGGTPGRELSR